MITDLQAELDVYASEVDRLYSPIWNCLNAQKQQTSDEPVPVR
jgi:hypothetical protein